MTWGTVATVAGSLIGGGLAYKGAGEAAEVGAEGQTAAAQIISQQADEARKMIFQTVPIGEQNLLTGQQATLDLLGQTLGPQIQLGRGGNIAAQQTLLAGLPQQKAAILGQPSDLSGLQVYQGGAIPDINYQLPQFQSAIAPGLTAGMEAEQAQVGQTTDIISQTYQELLGRAPDPSALAYYSQLVAPGGLASPTGTEAMRAEIMGSQEFQALQGGT